MPLHRVALLLLLFLSAPSLAGAVTIEKGVKLGVNVANLRGDFADLANPDAKLGMVGGPFLALDLAPGFALQVEVLYSMKGAKMTGTSTDDAGNVLGTFHTFEGLNYLEVPLLLRGMPLPGARVEPLIVAGPTLGFGLRADLTSDEPGLPNVKLDHLKALDLGFAAGVGARFRAGRTRVIAEARYTTGFSDVWDISGNLESINSVFSFTMGLAF